MKTITKNYNVYSFDELSQEAKDKARAEHNQNNDYFFLQSAMNEKLHELLEFNGITDLNDTSKAGTKPTPVLYSLSHCQGDGAMFEGVFSFPTATEKEGGQWKKYQVVVKHVGRYCHSYSKEIETVNETVKKEFDVVYHKICKELEEYGYNFMEEEDSEENFREICEADEYTFLEDGKMFKE